MPGSSPGVKFVEFTGNSLPDPHYYCESDMDVYDSALDDFLSGRDTEPNIIVHVNVTNSYTRYCKVKEITDCLLAATEEQEISKIGTDWRLSNQEIKKCKTIADLIFEGLMKAINEEELILTSESIKLPSEELQDTECDQAISGPSVSPS